MRDGAWRGLVGPGPVRFGYQKKVFLAGHGCVVPGVVRSVGAWFGSDLIFC